MKQNRPVCNGSCFACEYPDCINWSQKMTEFEKKCARIANEPEAKQAEHTIREIHLYQSGRRISPDCKTIMPKEW